MTSPATHTPPDAPPAGTRTHWGIVGAHLLGAALIQSVGQATLFVLPVIAQKQFQADEWQTLLITAPPTVLYVFSIFWNDLFNRVGGARAFIAFWLLACLPLAAMSFATSYWWLLIPHLIACAGGAGWPPLSGSLLRSLYHVSDRPRAYGIVWGGQIVGSAVLGYAIGEYLSRNPEAFRIYMPGAVALQLAGVVLLLVLARWTGHLKDLAPARDAGAQRWSLRSALDPILHMTRTLREDPVFARYEGAYMTYGIGWMIAYALLPLMVEKKLHLDYDAFARSTHVAYLGALVLTIYPAAWLTGKIGAVRATGVSFAMLALYPVGLALARNERELLIVSIYFGVAHAGASVGWMLGPVSLAPTPDRVPTYVAIHATLVGVRGALFQFVGVGIYWLCSRVLDLSPGAAFGAPLALAAAAYAWSAWQMRTLWKVAGGTRVGV